VDAWSPGFARALSRLAPGAALVPADDVVRSARAVKLPEEVDRIAAAVGVARSGLEAAADVVMAGGGAAAARAAALTALAARGGLVPTSGVAVVPVAAGDPRRRVDVGVLVDAYEGGIGRTVRLDGPVVADDGPAAEAQRRILAACRAGATGADIARAASDAGADHWLVRGSGMGYEPPVVTGDFGAAATLAAGMVLSVEVGVSGDHRRDLVLVTDEDAARLL
jgi:Xaa-Pro aminopeptidase